MTAIYACPYCAALVSADTGVRVHQRWHETLEHQVQELEISNWPSAPDATL